MQQPLLVSIGHDRTVTNMDMNTNKVIFKSLSDSFMILQERCENILVHPHNLLTISTSGH